MSIPHHSENPEEAAARDLLLRQFLGDTKRTWPKGRIDGDDDGATAYAIAADPVRKLVLIRFPKPMDWIGLDVPAALHLREKLNEKLGELGVHPSQPPPTCSP